MGAVHGACVFVEALGFSLLEARAVAYRIVSYLPTGVRPAHPRRRHASHQVPAHRTQKDRGLTPLQARTANSSSKATGARTHSNRRAHESPYCKGQASRNSSAEQQASHRFPNTAPSPSPYACCVDSVSADTQRSWGRREQGLSLPKMGLNITHDLIFIFTKGGVFLSVF